MMKSLTTTDATKASQCENRRNFEIFKCKLKITLKNITFQNEFVMYQRVVSCDCEFLGQNVKWGLE